MANDQFLPMSGFRDVLGPTKSWVIGELQKTFQEFGYQALETPAIERQEILLGKLGDEGQKQLYLFEDNGKRKVGLRYDLTVPLSRFVAGNLGSLPLPFKRYEIGPAWRAEKPQKGRYRQFTQADVDIIGAPEPASERELLMLIKAAGDRLGVKLTLQLNDRRIVASLLDHLKIHVNIRTGLLQLLDKKDKMTEEKFDQLFKLLGLNDVERRQLAGFFLTDDEDNFSRIEKLLEIPEMLSLKNLLTEAKAIGLEAKFVPSMVRGLDYYTGTIIEGVTPNYDGGTIVAGGRYDSLVEGLTGQKVPAVGVSFGVDRLSDLLAGPSKDETIFIVRLPETSTEVNHWAADLREKGKKVEVYLDETMPLGGQIKYADKRGYASILIPLEDEWKKARIVKKFLQSGKQEAVERQEF